MQTCANTLVLHECIHEDTCSQGRDMFDSQTHILTRHTQADTHRFNFLCVSACCSISIDNVRLFVFLGFRDDFFWDKTGFYLLQPQNMYTVVPETLPDRNNNLSRCSITHTQLYPRNDAQFSSLCCVPACCALTCLGVSSLVGDLVDGVQQSLLVAVRVQLELCASVVTELGDGHLSHNTGT